MGSGSKASVSPSAKAEVVWPGEFQAWPIPAADTRTDIHMYTEEDIILCKRWFSEEANIDFKKWATARVDTPKEWMDLELVIGTVLEVESREWSIRSKEACQEVWRKKGETSGKHHNTPADNVSIGSRTAELVLADSKIPWVEEALEWARRAFTALAPRMNSLAKKKMKAVRARDSAEGGTRAGKEATTSTAITTTSNTGPSLPEIPLTKKIGNVESASKKQKTAQGGPARKITEEEPVHLPHKSQVFWQRPVCNRILVVQLDHDIAIQCDAPRYIVVGISAIVEDRAQELHHVDIRCNHLSWARFKQVLVETDPAYDMVGARKLFWTDPSLSGSGAQPVAMEIKNEAEFRCAVGTLDWSTRQDQTEGLVGLMMMKIKDTYRY